MHAGLAGRVKDVSDLYEIALCDDSTDFAAVFAQRVEAAFAARSSAARVTVFDAPEALETAIREGSRFDLLFLDVIFAGTQRGLALAGLLRAQGCDADIIFISVSPNFAVASFDAAPLHYLLKPVADDRLNAAVARFLAKNEPYLLRFETNHGCLQLPLAQVTFFEIYTREIIIHMADGGRETSMGTLKELETRLPADTFVRPHRSYLVNLDYIAKISRYQIRLSTGDLVPVSKRLYNDMQSAIINHADRRSVTL